MQEDYCELEASQMEWGDTLYPTPMTLHTGKVMLVWIQAKLCSIECRLMCEVCP